MSANMIQRVKVDVELRFTQANILFDVLARSALK